MRPDGHKLYPADDRRLAARSGRNASAFGHIRQHLARPCQQPLGVADCGGNARLYQLAVKLVKLALLHQVIHIISVARLRRNSARRSVRLLEVAQRHKLAHFVPHRCGGNGHARQSKQLF